MLKRIFIRLICLPLLALLVFCTTSDDTLLSPGEANLRVLAAYAAKDLECGQQHQLTIPVFADATAESIDLCVFNILSQPCSVWGGADNLPAACLAISISL